MKNLSQIQLLKLWSELEACYHEHGKHSSNSCEIYANTLFTPVVCCNLPLSTDFGKEARDEQVRLAELSLVDVCTLFCKLHKCNITIDDMPIRKWLKVDSKGTWVRSHIKIV